MRIIHTSLLIVCLLNCCTPNNQPNESVSRVTEKSVSKATIDQSDSLFKYHFNVLDSVMVAHVNDSLYYNCTPSINFMENNTKIEASSDGTSLGRLTFTKNDLQKWHEWYNRNHK